MDTEPAGGPRDDTERQAMLDLAVVALLGSEARWTAAEVCAQAECDRDTADGLWRAMGFPDAPDDEVAFTDRDVAALRGALALQASGIVDGEAVRAQTRVMSQALATIAAAHLEITDPGERDVDRLQTFVGDVLPALDDLLVYLYRRHLLAEVERTVLRDRTDIDPAAPTMTVGFADLVGFTRVANHLAEDELAELVEAFTRSAADVVAEGAGRVVKMIGDEVMFTHLDPVAATDIALRLVEEVGGRAGLPALRAGVAAGPVMLRHGDVFGPTANLAHRLVDVARPASVLVDEDVADALAGRDDLATVRIAGIRRLRGFDKVRVSAVRRRSDEERDAR